MRGQDSWEREVLHRVDLLYMDDSMVVSVDLFWMQGSFNTLTGLLDRVGIQTNIWKTVRVLYCTFHAVGT